MKILYDHQIFTSQKFGGVSRYFYEIIKKFDVVDDMKIKLPVKFSNNYYLSSGSYYAQYHNFSFSTDFKARRMFVSVVNKLNAIKHIKKHDFDLFHPTYYDTYFLKYLKGKPFVLTVYDMIYERFASGFVDSCLTIQYKKELCKKASKIIAISESTKKDIIKFLDIEPSKIDVVYLANSLSLNNHINLKIKLPERYILFVGSRGGYKNFFRFILVVNGLLKVNDNLSVVCVGGGRFNSKEKQLLDNLKICNRVVQCDVEDKYLPFLYKEAEMFVFPSLYEGFGMPILEAFACKCPVVCSNAGSLPEVAGNGAEYFNPQDEQSMYLTMQIVLNKEDKRKKMITAGQERLKAFSWDKTAKKTRDVYRDVLNCGW